MVVGFKGSMTEDPVAGVTCVCLFGAGFGKCRESLSGLRKSHGQVEFVAEIPLHREQPLEQGATPVRMRGVGGEASTSPSNFAPASTVPTCPLSPRKESFMGKAFNFDGLS